MKLILVPSFLMMTCISFPSLADKKLNPQKCTTENHCAVDSKFIVRVDRVKKRGTFVLLQLKYKSTTKYTYSVIYSQATLIDIEGNEAIIEGSNITGFSSRDKGSEKNVSLKFKAEGFKWGEKFDLEVKADEPHGSIAFFDLVPN